MDSNRIVVSGVFWDKMTQEQQDAFTTYAKEMFDESIATTKEQENDYLAKLEESGVTVVDLTEQDYEDLAALAREKCWPSIIDTYGQDVYDEMMAFYNK